MIMKRTLMIMKRTLMIKKWMLMIKKEHRWKETNTEYKMNRHLWLY